MKNELLDMFDFDDVSICVASADKKVLFQNSGCESICGSQIDKFCKKCQDAFSTADQQKLHPFAKRSAATFSTQKNIANTTCTVYRHEEKNNKILTVFSKTAKKKQNFTQYFRKKKLTKREIEIAHLILKKESNANMCALLNVSKSTLKTHLNNLYKKEPALKHFRVNRIHNDEYASICLSAL